MSAFPKAMCALLTPFAPSGVIDLAAHRHNVRSLADAGMRAVVVGGSTGEGPLLEPGERRTLAAEARRAGAETVVVGVAAESVRMAHAAVCEAAEAAADAALVLAPTGIGRGDQATQSRFYLRLVEASPIPLMLYSITKNTGFALDPDLVAELAPSFVGIKDSDGDVERLGRLAALDLLVYTGSTPTVHASLAAGCHGAITASANYLPSALHGLVKDPGPDAQRTISAVSSVVERHGLTGTAYAASLVGLRPGTRRAPLEAPLPPDAKREIERATSDLPRLA